MPKLKKSPSNKSLIPKVVAKAAANKSSGARLKGRPLVGVIMGSKSDWETMSVAVSTLEEFGIPCEAKIVSAHRTPNLMVTYAQSAAKRGLEILIAGAGGAAHLPGMTASLTSLPVIGVPVVSKQLKGLDSLLSIAQMPAGIPVATVAIGNARNAGLLAVRMLGIKHPHLRKAVDDFMKRQEKEVRSHRLDKV